MGARSEGFWCVRSRYLTRGTLLCRARAGNPAGLHLWSGLTAADAKAGIRGAGSRLSSQIIGAEKYFQASGMTDPVPDTIPAVLLPGYDEYIVGYRDRSAVLDPATAGRTVIGTNGMMLPTIVIDGLVAGTWKRTLRKREISLSLHPFSPPEPAIR